MEILTGLVAIHNSVEEINKNIKEMTTGAIEITNNFNEFDDAIEEIRDSF